MEKPIYFDYNSTTPVSDRVMEKMMPYFQRHFGNAHSALHSYGWEADGAQEVARNQVAKLFNCSSDEIVFNSGATEGINTVLQGLFYKFENYRNHIITCKTEHSAVYECCKFLESRGAAVTYLDVNQEGLIDLDELKASITDQTFLVAIMMANNETGVVQDVKSIGEIAHRYGLIFFSDTTQACGKIPLDVQDLGIDAAVVSGHKIYGPKGVGALFLRRRGPRVTPFPLLFGGGQEKDLRGGTINVAGIVGLGEACMDAQENLDQFAKLAKWQTKIEEEIIQIGMDINGGANRLPNVSSIVLPFNAFDFIKRNQDKIALSLGSACSSGSGKPSRVLTAMFKEKTRVKNSVRISLGKMTKEEEVLKLISLLKQAW